MDLEVCRWRRWRWWFCRCVVGFGDIPSISRLSTWRGIWCFYHDFLFKTGFVRILGQIQQFEHQSPEPIKILHSPCLCCWCSFYSLPSILLLPGESAHPQGLLGHSARPTINSSTVIQVKHYVRSFVPGKRGIPLRRVCVFFCDF